MPSPDHHSLETPPPAPREEILPTNTVRHVVVDYPRIILFAVGVFLFLHFFQSIAHALMLFVFAILFAIVLNAPVRFLERHGVKRGISVAGVAVILLTAIGATIYTVGPPLAQQAVSVVQEAPGRAEKLRDKIIAQTKDHPQVADFLKRNQNIVEPTEIAKRAAAFLPRIGRYTIGFIGALATSFLLFVLTLYIIANPKPLIKGVLSAVPLGYRDTAMRAMARIVGQLEAWALATLILMAVIGVLCGVGLWVLHVPNALLFGVIAALGEAVPTLGPILSAVPPFAVAVADEPVKGIKVLLLYLVMQQLENHLLVPFIMSKNLNLHPVSILFFVVALGALLGVPGVLLAVPTAIVVKILFEEFYLRDRKPSEAALNAAAETVVAGIKPTKA